MLHRILVFALLTMTSHLCNQGCAQELSKEGRAQKASMTSSLTPLWKDATCRIDDLVFIAQKQIPPEFDTIPYRDLGSEVPRERVEIDIDTDHELVIGELAMLPNSASILHPWMQR